MPKVRLYIDLWPGAGLSHVMGLVQPGPISPGVVRCAVDVELPDPLFPHIVLPDAHAFVVNPAEGIERALRASLFEEAQAKKKKS